MQVARIVHGRSTPTNHASRLLKYHLLLSSLYNLLFCVSPCFHHRNTQSLSWLKIYKKTSKNYITWLQIPFHFPLNLFFSFQQSILRYTPSLVFLFICMFLHSRSSLLFLCSTVFYHGHKRALHYSKYTIPPSLSYPGLSVSTGEKIHSFLSPYSNFFLTWTHFCTMAVLATDHFFKENYIKLYIYIHTIHTRVYLYTFCVYMCVHACIARMYERAYICV